MFLHRAQSTYGRLIPKPAHETKQEEVLEEFIPIQDQIEALSSKIQLKQRYNKVLKEELKESRLGASSILVDLLAETAELREQLNEAINSEKAAVQNALRTHREFQLAMTDKTANVAIAWLEDKLFDIAKLLNAHICRLKERRTALNEAEIIVIQIEKWPRPGTLPWEVDAISNFCRLESEIENMKVSLGTANILFSNLNEIRQLLLEERGKYAPIIRGLEEQVASSKAEEKVMQKMLEDAVIFHEDAVKNLAITEKEATENRRKRRKQMAKMRKSVTAVLQRNQAKAQETVKRYSLEMEGSGWTETATGRKRSAKVDILESLRLKRMEIEQCQGRVKRLVDTMRVPDLTHIPTRYRTTVVLGERLLSETDTKTRLRDLLLRQKNHLYLIMCHFSYTGNKIISEYKSRIDAYKQALKEVETNAGVINHHIVQYGEIIATLRMVAIALLDRLDDGRRRHMLHDYFPDALKLIIVRVKRLVTAVKDLESKFPEPATRNYATYVKNPTIGSRLVRVGTPEHSEEESDDEEMIDMKTPTRADIKARSARVIAQAKLRRGIAS